MPPMSTSRSFLIASSSSKPKLLLQHFIHRDSHHQYHPLGNHHFSSYLSGPRARLFFTSLSPPPRPAHHFQNPRMSNPRPRATSGKQPANPVPDAEADAAKAPQLQRQRSVSQRAISQTLTGTANLAKHLPTGTLLAFQLLVPVFTQNGVCDSVTRPLTLGLLVVLSLSCFLACFTDTIKAPDGQVYHGFATSKGIKLFDYPDPTGAGLDPKTLEKYKLRFIDFVHALLSVLMFGAVAFRDRSVVSCLYPAPAHETQEVLDIVPVGVGLICSLLFVVFPSRRHGIGYPVTGDADDKDE